jgi:hypothetical protein
MYAVCGVAVTSRPDKCPSDERVTRVRNGYGTRTTLPNRDESYRRVAYLVRTRITGYGRRVAALGDPRSQVFVQNECPMRSQPLPCASQLTYAWHNH